MSTYLFETEEHKTLRAQARKFAAAEVLPNALAWEEAGIFPRSLYGTMAEAGLLGIGYPEEWGGQGGDLGHVLVAAEEIVLAGKSVGTCVGLGSHGIALPPIVKFGTKAQKERYVRPVLRGERVSALGITEAGGGSDVAAVRTRAVLDGDHYVVNGSKTFITSGTRADFITTAVRTGGEGHGGISLLIIDTKTPGFSVTRKLDKMGWWASDTAELAFEDCRVPKENLIGAENAGFLMIMMNFVSERLLLAGQCVAIAELALRETIAYSRERQAFGKTLNGFQVTRHKLAEMETRLGGGARADQRGRAALPEGRWGPGAGGHGQEHGHGHVHLRVRPSRAAARWLRLHARVPGGAAVPRRAALPAGWRHARDHERDHREDAPLLTVEAGPRAWAALRPVEAACRSRTWRPHAG
jgi:acyl-CoA dehydrogenase